MSGAALSLTGLGFRYGTRHVLTQVSLEVAAGERIALLGANGAGKSTLLSLVSGTLPMQSGRVRIDGRDLVELVPRDRAKQIAMVAQDPAVPFAFTVQEWVSLGRTPFLKPLAGESHTDRLAVADAMEWAGVTELADRLVGEISGGERQRASLAQALAQEPRLLLLDEATAHLDLRHQMSLLEKVSQRSREAGLTVIAAIHDVNLAALWFDRLIVLHAGTVLADGAPRDVLRPDLLLTAFGCHVTVVPHPTADVPLVALVSGR